MQCEDFMVNLVELLRNAAEHSVWPTSDLKEKTLFWIAAEEIERLRFLVEQLKKQFHDNEKENRSFKFS